jgi:pimeloyl-ACP methyl ester carboxylesterase
VDNLERLIEHLGLVDITLVSQDWGGPIGTAYAMRHPSSIKRMCFMNTVPPGTPAAGVPTRLSLVHLGAD